MRRKNRRQTLTGATAPVQPPDDLGVAEKEAASKSPWLSEVLDNVDLREALSYAKIGCSAIRIKHRWYGSTRRQKVHVTLDLERLRLTWQPEGAKREKEMGLVHVKRFLPAAEVADWVYFPSGMRELGLDVQCVDGWRVRLVFESNMAHKFWGRSLLYAISKTLAKRQRIDLFEDQVLVLLFRSVDTDKSGSVQLSEVLDFLGDLGLNCDMRYVANLFFSLTDDQSCVLEIDEFLKFMATLLTEEHLVALFNRLVGNSGNCTLSEADLKSSFFDTIHHRKDFHNAIEQFEQMRPPFSYAPQLDGAYPPLATAQVVGPHHARRRRRRLRGSLSSRTEDQPPNITDLAPQFREDKGGLTVYGFCQYIMSDHNSLFSPEKWDTLYQDMNLPLTHYWIKTALAPLDTHNAPRLENSLMTLRPTNAMKELSLQVRLSKLVSALVEENCRALVFVLLAQAGVLFAETFDGFLVPFTAVLDAIVPCAFVRNPFPVTLLIDDSRLNVGNRNGLWEMIRRMMGTSLIEGQSFLVGQSKNKFIAQGIPSIEFHKLKDVKTSWYNEIIEEQITVDELYTVSGFGDLRGSATNGTLKRCTLDAAPSEKTNPHVFYAQTVEMAANAAAQGQWVAWPQSLLREAATRPSMRAKIIQITRQVPTVAMPYGGFGCALSEENCLIARTAGVTFIPYSHLPHYLTGYIGFGPLMDTARFRVNGGIGYVAKPKSLIDANPTDFPAFDVELEVLSVRQVPRILPDRMTETQRMATIGVKVVVGVDGVQVASTADGVSEGIYSVREHQTETVSTVGLAAHFNRGTTLWHDVSPNVSMLTFAVDVWENNLGTFTRTAWAAVPVNVLRAGFRWVPLWDRSMKQLEWSGILVRVNCRALRRMRNEGLLDNV